MIKATEILAYIQQQFTSHQSDPQAPLTDASLKALMQHDANLQHYDVICQLIKDPYVPINDFLMRLNHTVELSINWADDDQRTELMHLITLIQPLLSLVTKTSVTNGADNQLSTLAKLMTKGITMVANSRANPGASVSAMLRHTMQTLNTGPNEGLTIKNRWVVKDNDNLWIENWHHLQFATLQDLYQYLGQCWSLVYDPQDIKLGARKDDEHAQDSEK